MATLTLLTELVLSGMKGMGFKDLFQVFTTVIYNTYNASLSQIDDKAVLNRLVPSQVTLD